MKKKCVPEGQQKGKGQARGQGEGPMGTPKKEGKIMNKVKEAIKLVDTVFDNPSEFKIINRVNEANKLADNILENCGKDHSVEEVENQLQNAPIDDPEEEADRVRDDIAGEDEATPGGEDESAIEMKLFEKRMSMPEVKAKLKKAADKCKKYEDRKERQKCMTAAMRKTYQEWKTAFVYESAVEGATEMIDMYIKREAMNAYQKFVQSKLKAAGVKSPAQMDPAKRKAFFSNLSKEWKAKKGV